MCRPSVFAALQGNNAAKHSMNFFGEARKSLELNPKKKGVSDQKHPFLNIISYYFKLP